MSWLSVMPNMRAKGDALPLYQWLLRWEETRSTEIPEDSAGDLSSVPLTKLQPVSMSEEAPGVSPGPLWAAKRPGNLSWCSCCQPGCCATAVCHPGGWGLLKGNHVNLSVTIQSKAVGWSWQAWQSRRTVLKAVLQRHNVDTGFPCLSILLSWNRLRHVEFSFRAGHLGWTYYPLSFFHNKNSDLLPGYLWTERDTHHY